MGLNPHLLFLLLYSMSCAFLASTENQNQRISNKWKTDAWSTCHTSQECGEGWQNRNVYCISSSEDLILQESACDLSLKPATFRLCFKVCKQHKPFLRWSVGPWSQCLSSDPSPPCKNDQNLVGEAHREVHCLFNSTKDGLEKIISNIACKYFWTQPLSSQACSLECPQDCIVVGDGEQISGDWEPKLESSEVVLVAPTPGGKSCSRSKSPCLNGQQCVVDRNEGYVLKVHEWGPCLPIEEMDHRYDYSFSMFPALGRTTRNITCLNNKTGEIVEPRLCNSLEQRVEQLCVVGSDCEASPWSEWKVEREGCRNSQGVTIPEIRNRVRNLVRGAVGSGAPCGPLSERRTITGHLPPCEKYKWHESEWGDCVLYTHYKIDKVKTIVPKCGGGVKIRNLTCIRISDSVPVNKNMCLDPKPPHVQRCSISCTRDCKVSHWSKWGPCLSMNHGLEQLDILENGFRTRSRSILVRASEHGKDCPHIEEHVFCEDTNGHNFNYRFGEWSECKPQDSRKLCGVGERRRDITCLANGDPDKERYCTVLMKNSILTPETSQKCHVPCPSDCILSEWSHWTICFDQGSKSTSNRTVLAIEDHTGQQCHLKRQKEKNCESLQSLKPIYWKAQPWGPCSPLNGTCGHGVRKREIVCNRGALLYAASYSCNGIPKPAEEQTCIVPCPVDCVVTKFSDWSTCISPCSIEIQTRKRFVLQINKHGGNSCPEPLEESRLCSFNGTSCMSYAMEMNSQSSIFQWQTGNWSDCILPMVNHFCGTGFQIRNVSCVDIDNKEVEMHWCTRAMENKPKNLSKLVELIPAHFRLCHVMCPLNRAPCTLSAWSSWSECHHHYFQPKRVRTREFIGESAERADCLERYALREEDICPRLEPRYVFSGPFGSCIVENQNQTMVAVNSRVSPQSCGIGYRRRSGLQMDGLDAVEQGVEKDLCVVECPIDCLMSDWSSWSPCNATCGQGYRTKYRSVLQPPNSLGRPCPSNLDGIVESQVDVCETPCPDFNWVAYGWENCVLRHSKNSIRKCGNGIHHRSVKCIETESKRYANEKHCDSVTRPISESSCRTHCPGECVVSEWEMWKPCFNPCRPNDTVEKRRRVLRAANYKHPPCPDLVKTEDCVLNETCFVFSWKLGTWGTCVLPEGAACGEGLQRRARVCERSDGRLVDGVHCEKKESLPKHLTEDLLSSKPCYTDCPIDCVVSEWSEWDKTRCGKCGKIDMMVRERKIVQAASDAGQPCPTELKQTSPCSFNPCYHWHLNWTDCDLAGLTCGTGVRRRLVGCVRYDGLQVDKLHCLVTNITFPIKDWLDPKWLIQGHDKAEEEKCHVQCPGDCILSEWSEWSHCHKDCTKGQMIGYKTSSRFIIAPNSIATGQCSDVLIRTRPCWDAECYTFSWKYRNNSLHCERSDGLIVKGGCTRKALPCHPNCESVFGGICNPVTGACICEFSNGEIKILSSEFGNSDNVCENSPPALAIKQPPRRPANHTAPTQEIPLKYYPDDREPSVWMYAMISIGTAFVIFVGVTVYLMCRSSIHRRMASVHRQASVRRREINNQEKHAYGQTAVCNKSFE